MHRGRKHFWISLSAIALLAVLCGAVAILQYRWTGEISEAEQQRLREDLRERLDDLRRHFNDEVSGAARGLQPSQEQVEQLGIRGAYEARYRSWKDANASLFSHVGLAERRGNSLDFYLLDPDHETFVRASVPETWTGLWDQLEARAQGERPPPRQPRSDDLIEMPLFGRPDGDGPGERAWLVLELNLESMRTRVLPEAVRRYLLTGGRLEYQVEVVSIAGPQRVIYQPGAEVLPENADGEIQLLDDGPGRPNPGGGGPPRGPGPGREGPRDRKGRGDRDGGPRRGGEPPALPGGPGRWTLLVRHQSGSLEALVAQTRRRNLAISAGMLVLILATSAILVRYTRRMRELAELQMNFVAGVSHELRTPLTVIRTAGFNLRRAHGQNPGRVEQYGALIEEESEKLSALVEQVLQFGRASNGEAPRRKAPVRAEDVIDEALAATRPSERVPGIKIEKRIAVDLPPMLADHVALSHALQNLIQNALKYGTNVEPWLGIDASPVNEQGRWIEIRVADRGPGIPRAEQSRIFDPFFRGKRAVDDQIHGTGLGLNLVKKIVEAQGGSIRFESNPDAGATFIVRMPAFTESSRNEVANSTN